MNDVDKNRISRLIGLCSLVAIVSLGACTGSPDDSATTVNELRLGRQTEIVRCCERRVPPWRRAECIVEAVHDHGVCAPQGAGGAGGKAGAGGGGKAGAGATGGAGGGSQGGAGATGGAGGTAGAAGCALAISAITPSQTVAPIHGTIPLNVQFFDPNHPDARATILWSATTQSIVGPTSSPATLQCTQPGPSNVTVTVSEGTCTASASTTITCGSCGDGILDPGEQCDPPNGTTCGSVCQTIVAGCTCNFPDGQLCQACQWTACGSCFYASLFPMSIPVGPPPNICGGLTSADLTNCLAVVDCESAVLGGCALKGLLGCYCSDQTCSAGANGPCAGQINALAGTTDPAAVIAQFQNPFGLLAQIRNLELSFAHSSCGLTCQ